MSSNLDSLPPSSGSIGGRAATSLVAARTGGAAPPSLSRGARPSGADRSVLFCGEVMGPIAPESVERHAGDAVAAARGVLGRSPLVGEGSSWRERSAAEFCRGLAIGRSIGAADGARVGGYGLGELVAISVAGRLGAGDGLRLAVERGAAVDAALHRDPGAGSILIEGEFRAVARLAGRFGIAPAVIFDDRRSVYAGPSWALAALEARALRCGLRVEAAEMPALHSPSMEPGRAALLGSGPLGAVARRTAPGVLGPLRDELSIADRISLGLVGAVDVRTLSEAPDEADVPLRIGALPGSPPQPGDPLPGGRGPAAVQPGSTEGP